VVYILGQDDKPPLEEFALQHYGVKGMRWGVRRSRTERAAAKDAKEFARAKMFYGEGAGTRRKLIREKVNSRKKADPNYAKAFDKAFESQDLGKHGDKARRERSRADTKKNTKQRAGYLARQFTGEMGNKAAFTAVMLGGAAFLANPNNRAKMGAAYSNLRESAQFRNTTKQGKAMFDEAMRQARR
jgi:hypothetical protein